MDKQSIRQTRSALNFFFNAAMITIISVGSMCSCAPIKNTYYFQSLKKDTTLNAFVDKNFDSKIIKGDNLSIQITSLSKDEDAIFNSGVGLGAGGVTTTAVGFLVDPSGDILIHRLGKVKASGLTRKELSTYLAKELEPYLKDPIVTVQYLNHKVTIMGAVSRPQVLNMPEEQLSVIDALVLSGDVNEKALRSNIMIIRDSLDRKIVKHINLEDQSIFSSPWYFVQPNDIVLVNPDFVTIEKEERRKRFQSNLAIFVSAFSVAIIVLDRILR